MKALDVLVVEDDAMIGVLLGEMLEAMGYGVCALETTGAGAAVRYRPDLMIVDARLSDGSGVTAVDKILRTGFVPHVFISGDASRVRALRPDAVIIQKPFRELDLARGIRQALDATMVS